jgi:hypothetical protein
MEDSDSAWYNEWTPLFPILPDPLFRMISIDQQEIDRFLPRANCIETELLHPNNTAATRTFDRSVRGPLGEIEKWKPAQMKRID